MSGICLSLTWQRISKITLNLYSRLFTISAGYFDLSFFYLIFDYFLSVLLPVSYLRDIPHVHYSNPERVNHPTQKPEVLVKRIILASSNK
jgi:DNA modification methylase